VYGPPMTSRSGVNAQRPNHALDEEAVEEASRVISNLGL